jgi:hypothetical protein
MSKSNKKSKITKAQKQANHIAKMAKAQAAKPQVIHTQAQGAKMQTQNPYMTTTKITRLIDDTFLVPMKWSVLLFTNGSGYTIAMPALGRENITPTFGMLNKEVKLSNRMKGKKLVGTFCLYNGEFNVADLSVDTNKFQKAIDAYINGDFK